MEKLFERGILDNKNAMTGVDAKSMLCLYGIVQTQEEYEAIFPTTLSEQNVGERILQDMQFFSYFQRRKLVSSQQILEHLYKIKIHLSVWQNRRWLRSKIPKAYVKRGFLYYQEKKNGKVVQRKIWLYSKKLESMKTKSTIESILDELKIVD